VAAQSQPVDSAHFFTEEKVVAIQLSSDLKKLMVSKAQKDRQPAMVTCRFPDSTVITEPINVYARGIFRRQNCYMPSLMLDFKNKTSPLLRGLHSLKLVGGCRVGKDYEQLLLKEYIIYKIYNLLTDKSFRVRLVYMTYDDTQKKVKSYSQYGFLLENMDELTRRNHCRELKKVKVPTQATDRKQMTLVDIFQYMIGNTDWSVPVYHNIRLMQPEDDSAARPYVIPYDFDFSGLVNAEYAAPAPELGTESVTERVYRGFPRSMQEIQETLDLFRQKKDSIYALINHFDLLWEGTRREMTGYLDDFYSTINNKDQVQQVFIDNARLR
ncbi:MAG TPA: hypothetical protein VG870_08005, partial [Chitinophagaceae bacterium]|nr:hypothetical protein [Chitinophagaceae bacterium]